MKQAKASRRQKMSTIMRLLQIADVKSPHQYDIDNPDYWVDGDFYNSRRKIQGLYHCGILLLRDSSGKPFAVYLKPGIWGVIPLCDIIRVNITQRDRVAEQLRRAASQHSEAAERLHIKRMSDDWSNATRGNTPMD